MLFWSNSSTAPSDDSRSDARARSRRSERSRAKSMRCSQSTAMVAPREAMFMDALLLVGDDETAAFVQEYRTSCGASGVAAERSWSGRAHDFTDHEARRPADQRTPNPSNGPRES